MKCDVLFLLLVIAPAVLAMSDTNFVHSQSYLFVLFMFSGAWAFGAGIAGLFYLCRGPKNLIARRDSSYELQVSFATRLTTIIVGSYFVVSGNIGVLGDDIRLSLEGGVAHKLLLLNILVIASYGLKGMKTLCAFLVVTVLTGWKSVFLYAVIAAMHQVRIDWIVVTKIAVASLIVLAIFAGMNLTRQGLEFSEVNSIGSLLFLDVFYYYLIYGFLNFSLNIADVPNLSFFAAVDLGFSQVHPTWNVQSGFHGLLATFGVFGSCIYLAALRSLAPISIQGPVGNYFHYIAVLTAIMLHNTIIALSPIVLLFPLFLLGIRYARRAGLRKLTHSTS
jgi:hypothetical protein